MTANVYADALEKILVTHCTPKVVREIESNLRPGALWSTLCESGFPDALVPEANGGAGLRLDDVFSMLLACGSNALPVPLGFTMFARAFMTEAGIEAPPDPITVATAQPDQSGEIRCQAVVCGMVATWVLVDLGAKVVLLPASEATRERAGTEGSLAANMRWDGMVDIKPIPTNVELRITAAALVAAEMAGALGELLKRSVAHANDRKQFGKSIGKFQAIQQQLSAAAEQVFAAHIAAEQGCRTAVSSSSFVAAPMGAAAAKARCSESVMSVTSVAHGVHGAIGVTQDFDLQLFARRLHEWRQAFGGEVYWHRRLGSALLSRNYSTLDFIRSQIVGPEMRT